MAEQQLVILDGHNYSLTAAPEPGSPLVQSARAVVLRDLKLEQLVLGLHQSRGLLDLAFHGVSGSGDLRARVRSLQDNLLKLAGDASATMTSISANSGSIVRALGDVFRFLLLGKEQTAIKLLAACSAYAHAMAERAGTLADRFEALGNEASETVGATMREQGAQIKEKERLQAEREEAERRTKALNETVRLLAEDKADLAAKYEEMKVAAETAENRAFAMALVGAILKPLAQGVGAAAGVYASSMGGGMPMGAGAGAGGSRPTEGRPGGAAGNNGTAARPADSSISPSTEKLLKLFDKAAGDSTEPESIDTLRAVLAAESAEQKARLRAEIQQVLAEAKAQAGQADGSSTAWRAAGEGVKAAGDAAGDSLSEAGNDYARVAEGYQKQKIETLKLMQEVRRQEREALVAIVDFAERMKAVKELQTINQSVLDALLQAVGALQQVVVVLRQSQLFWTNMKTAFETLSQSTLGVQLEGYMDLPVEDKRAIYLEPDFARSILEYVASWQALKLIADEYGVACSKVRVGIEKDYQKNLAPEEAVRAVPELAQRLLADLRPALEAADSDAVAISDALLLEQAA